MIGTAIKKIRKSKNLKQIEFAKKIKISTSSLSAIEQGARKPSLRMLEKIAKGFDLPLSIIFWFTIKREEIDDDKKEAFDILRPAIDDMILSLFNTK